MMRLFWKQGWYPVGILYLLISSAIGWGLFTGSKELLEYYPVALVAVSNILSGIGFFCLTPPEAQLPKHLDGFTFALTAVVVGFLVSVLNGGYRDDAFAYTPLFFGWLAGGVSALILYKIARSERYMKRTESVAESRETRSENN